MKVLNLKVGMIIKNYKVMCGILEEEIKTSNSKISQMKVWERYVNFHSEGHKFIIDEIYKEPKEAIDNRVNNSSGDNNRKDSPNFLISRENENNIGVYKIILNNNIYVGSTTVGFRHRYMTHKGKNSTVPFTRDMLSDGATFEILEMCKGLNELQIRTKENEYIKLYKDNNNWIVVNTNTAYCNSKVIKKTYKTIKVETNNYEKASELLRINKLIS